MKRKLLFLIATIVVAVCVQYVVVPEARSQDDTKRSTILKRISQTSPEGLKIIEKIQAMKPEINGMRSAKTLIEIIQEYAFNVGPYGINPLGWEATEKAESAGNSLARWRIVFHYQDYTKQYLEAEWEYDPKAERLFPFDIKNATQFWTNDGPQDGTPSQRSKKEPIDSGAVQQQDYRGQENVKSHVGPIEPKEETIAGVATKVLFEYRSSFKTRFVEVVIPDESYSRENLERIWRHYCDKYADKKDQLDLRIYTNRSYEFNRQFRRQPVNMHTGETVGPNGTRVRLRDYEASFLRMGKGALAYGGENELMIYSPNLDEPEKKERIVLAGEDPFK